MTAVINSAESGRVNFSSNDLLLLSGYFSETNVPIEIQRKFFKIVVNKSRNALLTQNGDFDEAFNLLSLIVSDISTKFPELLGEAGAIQSALKIRVSKEYTEAQQRSERIKNSSDKLSALISEAEQTDDQADKYDLYISAAKLALKMGKFRRAVDLVEKTVELNKSKIVSDTFRKEWRDQFFVQVVETALKGGDPDSAGYAIKRMTDTLARAEGHKKTANYYYDKSNLVDAGYSLDEAVKLTMKAENTPQRIAAFINLIPVAQKIDKNLISDLYQLTGKSINALPVLNVEDKPDTENYKNYVTSIMIINWNLLPVLINLDKQSRSETRNLASATDKREVKIIADYLLMTDAILEITKREKKQGKR
ncbi:MAG TPA: hypothetical protein VK308_00375 [Pyrinomonadaceae bacterium]|nr:hypothetical protein [Pyrinomonadaceae bacterium]